jgi:hypothetical protein
MKNSSAVFSHCRRYRYWLEREIGDGPTVVGLMINPSWADELYNDRTISKLIGFGQRNGWGKIIVGNKFAYRSQYPKDLVNCSDPVGPENDLYLRKMISVADICISAWGPVAKIPDRALRKRWEDISQMADEANKPLLCWGVAKDGHPLHPLMLPYSSTLRAWSSPKD